jgi:Phage gp6-like head-tail connector protein
MSLLTLAEARAHLRVGSTYPDDQIQPYLNSADEYVRAFLNRAVYATQGELDAARQALPAALQAAAQARDEALAAAAAVTDPTTAEWLRCAANDAYSQALSNAQRVQRGIVVNDGIKTALRLLLGHLDENRESVARGVSVTELPQGVEFFLLPYRAGWGG